MTLNWLARIGLTAAAATIITALTSFACVIRAELRREADQDAAEASLEDDEHAWLVQPSDPPPMVFKPAEREPFVHDPRFDPCGAGPIYPEVTP